MKLKLSIAAIASAFFVTQASAAPVDLSDWSDEGAGSWSLAADNNSAFQSVNGAPTVLFTNENSQGKSLSGQITVEETGGDDDFIGFVLGYKAGDIAGNPNTDYILIDWKQRDQAGWDAGLAISRVTGALGTNAGTSSDAWQHTGNVELLARATNLGDVGWEDNTTYNFEINFTATYISVFVNGVLEIAINGDFSDGGFGFYNFSQPRVRYAGITEDVAQPPSEVPLPAAFPLLLSGVGALGFFSRKKRKSA